MDKIILKPQKPDCTHEKAVEFSKNRFHCEECGGVFRKIRRSVLERRALLRW